MVRCFVLVVFYIFGTSMLMAQDILLPLEVEDQNDVENTLDNPLLSEPARINAVQKNNWRNGNMAVIIQKGAANKSVVRQSGDKNTAVQYQQGFDHELIADQESDDNVSEETQEGVRNKKVKIQRSQKDTPSVLIEQVQP